MKRSKIYLTQLKALKKCLIEDIAETTSKLLCLGGSENKESLDIDLTSETGHDLSSYVSVLVCDAGECDIEEREMVATIYLSLSDKEKTFKVRTEHDAIKSAEDLEIEDLLTLQDGMESAVTMVQDSILVVTDGLLTES